MSQIFLVQSNILMNRFLEKGYDQGTLTSTLNEVKGIDRIDLLRTKPRDTSKLPVVPFVTTFSTQHFSVKKLLKKHWHILKNDPILGPVLPDNPQVIFKGGSALRHKLAPNVLEPPVIKTTFLNSFTGFYQCRKCRVCSLSGCEHRRTHLFVSTATGEQHTIKPFITCATEGVVYLLQCPCGLQYVGRTKRALSVRLNEHISNILAGYLNHSVSKHYRLVHNRDPSKTIFLGIDRYAPHWRGSALVRSISKSEMQWIHRIKSYTPYGLNIEVDVNAFIDNS